MYIGQCKRGRYKWDYKRLAELIETGTPSQFIRGIKPNRVDTYGLTSDRPDYPWAKASKKKEFVLERDFNEHADGVSDYLETDDIFTTLCCAVFFWTGTCSLEIEDIQETF